MRLRKPWPYLRHGGSAGVGGPAGEMSHEGAEAGDSLADDQILHLIRAFVGVERFTIREEACRLVVGNDSVAAHQLTGPGNRLAAFGRGERLGKRGMGVRQLTFGMQLRLAHDPALRSRDDSS